MVRIFLHSDWIRRFTISVFSPDTGKYGPVFLLRWLPLKFIVVSLHFFRRLFADRVSTCCSSLRLVLFSSSRTFGRITRLFEVSCNLEISALCFQIFSSNNKTLFQDVFGLSIYKHIYLCVLRNVELYLEG